MRLFSERRADGLEMGYEKGGLEGEIVRCAEQLALVHGSIDQEDFLRRCIERLDAPKDGKRDTRRQRLVRALRRLDERGDLPFRVKGRRFVL